MEDFYCFKLILLEENGCPILLAGQLYSLIKKTPHLFPEDEDEVFMG